MKREKATFILRSKSNSAISAFIKNYPEAVQLHANMKLDGPTVIWSNAGLVHYAVFCECSYPGEKSPKAPLVFQICVNKYRSHALLDYLQTQEPSKAVTDILAKGPCLRVNAMPGQLPKLGGWLAHWYVHCCQRTMRPPIPPVELIVPTWTKDGSEQLLEFANLDSDWWEWDYLWTRRAYDAFMPWVKEEYK